MIRATYKDMRHVMEQPLEKEAVRRLNKKPETAKTEVQKVDSFLPRLKSSMNEKSDAVADYARKHPEDAAEVYRMVSEGEAVRNRMHPEKVDTEDMSMEEYKEYFQEMLDSIPYDATQQKDIQFLKISDAGWEQMKKDKDYEAWVLGYFQIDRLVKMPFGKTQSYHAEYFGASIEEHHGESYSVEKPSKAGRQQESWWEKRQKRHKEIMEEQEELALKRKADRAYEAQLAFARLQAERMKISGKEDYAYEELYNPLSAAADFFSPAASVSTRSIMK